MNGKVFVGQKALSLTEYEKKAPISGVILWVDDENYYEAGDETGTVIEQDCPYASQQMADNLLATLRGYSYQGLEANGAKMSPIAELGDGMTVAGLYTQLAYQNIRFSTGEVMDMAAPGSDETLHEYKTEGETTKHFSHQIAETRSTISKTAKEIRLEVENELKGLSSSFTVKLDSITSRVNGLDGKYTELSVTLDGVTIKDSSGETLIKGSSIQTNTLYVRAANITGTLSADQINLTGSISFSDLSNSVRNDINDAYSMAEDAQSAAADAADTVDRWTYKGTTFIDGTRIMTGTVSASTLEGGQISVLNRRGVEIGYISVGSSTSTGIQLICGGNLYFESAYCSIQMSSRYISVSCDALAPSGHAATLGDPSKGMWQTVYAYNGTIQTSDKNIKHDITEMPQKYLDMMDDITPVIYKMDNGTSGRLHTGFIAQNVKAAMDAHDVSSEEFAAWCKDADKNGGEIQMLRYDEFIAILWAKIKELERRIDI